MNTRIHPSKSLISLAALLAASGALLVTESPVLATPDYAPVLDPLFPATHLLRNDDLAVTLGQAIQETPGDQLNWVSSIPTSNSGGAQCQAHDDGTLCESGYDAWNTEGPPTTGRFFGGNTDDVVAIGGGAQRENYTVQTWYGSAGMVGSATMISQPLPYPNNNVTMSTTAVGDFDGDGFDDLAIAYSDYDTQFPGNARVRIATAVDVDNPSLGFDFGKEINLPTSTTDPTGLRYSIRSVAAGDFNGDGRTDLAVLYIDDYKNPNIAVYSVDDKRNLQLQETNLLLDPINYTGQDAPMQLVAGTFVPGNHRQLALVQTSDSYGLTRLHVFDFDAGSYYPKEKNNPYLANYMATKVRLVPGQFDWSTQTQALALMTTQVAASNSKSDVQVLRIDPKTYAISVAASVNVPQDMGGTNQNYVGLDIAVGNFDNTAPPPGGDGGAGYDAGAALRDPNLQLAIGVGNCREGCPGTGGKVSQFQLGAVNIYDVLDRTTGAYALKKRSAVPLHTIRGTAGPVTRMNLLAADLEGRSMRLGAGIKIALERTSPTVIVAQPPSHVDYAKPDPSAPPTVVNLGFAPDKFNSTFAQTVAKDTSLSHIDTKSWGLTTKASIGGQIKIGTINGDGSLKNGIDIQACFTAEQDVNSETDSTYGKSQSLADTISTQTSTSDVVWYDSGYEYLYIYEVMGKTACPSGQTTCDDSARVPLTVMFTAPGLEERSINAGDTLPWYQPVWENGNIFSYPANAAQLAYGLPPQQVMATSQTISTDSSGVEVSTTWTNSSTDGGSYTYSKQFRENGSLSVEYSSDAIPFASATAKLGVKVTADFGDSEGMSTVRTESTTVSASNNLILEKRVNFRDSSYGYSLTPYILGGSTPAGYLDGTDPLTPGSGLAPNPSQTEVFGPLRTAFTVDPVSKGGTFFTNNYSRAPDIALNHPSRWYYGRPSYDSPLPSNCLDTRDGYSNCAYLNARIPAFPGSDMFHKMRGFFVFNAGEGNPADPANQGMQQVSTTVGNLEVLEARVYNYSLAAMPTGATVHVRFYGMPWDKTHGFPVDPTGGSFFIGQYDAGGIPPFSTTAATPNYILATTTFDATGHDNQDLLFWVVAWGENADGSMMGELDGKGLTSNPRAVSSSAFVDLANLEPLVLDEWPATPPGDAGPKMTSFSNNIGIFPQVFHVFPKTSSTGLQGANALSDDPRPLAVSEVRAAQTALNVGEPTEISAMVHNQAQAIRGANAYFYDGDPLAGGKVFGVQRLTYMNAGDDQKAMVSYAPRTCGTHDIYMSVGDHGVENGAVRALESIQVTCDTPRAVRDDGRCDGGPVTPDNDGGCTMARGGTARVGGLFAPLAAMVAALWARRKRKA
jgi:hypothetical protein